VYQWKEWFNLTDLVLQLGTGQAPVLSSAFYNAWQKRKHGIITGLLCHRLALAVSLEECTKLLQLVICVQKLGPSKESQHLAVSSVHVTKKG
jgi:hypothetical protein